MRAGLCVVVLTTVVSGCVQDGQPQWDDRGVFARGDTGDSGLFLEPQCADPGFCGCDFTGLDLDTSGSVETCIHDTALIEGSVGIGARVEAGAEVRSNAVLGAGASLGVNSILGERATVGANAVIGDGVIIGRRAQIGARAHVGADSTIGRAAVIGDDVDASLGRLTMGYASGLGARSEVTGVDVIFGNLASVGADSTIAGGVVLARGATFGDFTDIGQGTIIGPEVTALDGAVIGSGTRIRKGVTLADDVTIGGNVRIGRDTDLREGSFVGDNAVLRALVTVGTNVRVDTDAYIPRGTVLEDEAGGPGGDPFAADEPPIVVITSPSHGADTNSGSITVTGTVTDDIGIEAVYVRIDNNAWQTVTLVNGTFTYTLTGIPDMSEVIEVRARDTSDQIGVDQVYVSDSSSSRSFTHIWTGAVSTDWSTAANWNTGSVPTSSSYVHVPQETARQPVLSADVQVSQTWLDTDAVITTGSYRLTVSSVHSGGQVLGAGGLVMPSGQVRGRVENMDVTGVVYPSGYLHVLDSMDIPAGNGRLHTGDVTVRVSGPFYQNINSSVDGLYMDNAGAIVHLDGDATFEGTSVMSTVNLGRGRIWVGGDMRVACTSSTSCFIGSGATFTFDGSAPQSVHFTYPSETGNRLSNIVVRNQAGVTMTKDTGTLAGFGFLRLLNGGVLTTQGYSSLGTIDTNVMTGNAHLQSTGTLSFGYDVDVRDGSAISADVIEFDRELFMEPSSGLAANRVDMYTELPHTSDYYTATTTRLMAVIYAREDRVLKMPKLEVPAGNGRLHVQDATIQVTGDYAQNINSSTDGMYMDHANSRVEIGGDALFEGTSVMHGANLGRGSVAIGGDMTVACVSSTACFTAVGTPFAFDGTEPQAVHFTYPGPSFNRFYDVIVSNPAGVSFTKAANTLTSTGTLSVIDGGVMHTESFDFTGINGTSTISGNATLTNTGTLSIASDTQVLDTSTIDGDVLVFGKAMDMEPTSHLDANRVDVTTKLPTTSDDYTATLTRLLGIAYVNADVDMKLPAFEIPAGSGRMHVNDATVTITGSFAQNINSSTDGMYLDHINARVEIGGDATFEGTAVINAANFSRGAVTVGGDMTVACTSSTVCFSSGGASFTFDGNTPQTVHFTYPGASYNKLFDVIVSNPAGVSFTRATGTLHSLGTLSIINGGAMSTEAFTFAATNGNSVMSGGASLTNTGLLSIASDMQVHDTSTIAGDQLQFGKALNLDPGAALSANRVDMVSKLPVTGNNYTAVTTRVIGVTNVSQDYDLDMPRLEVPYSAGRIQIGDARVTLTGDYVQAIDSSTDGLYLDHNNATFEVAGDASFGGAAVMNGANLSRGRVRLAGDLDVACVSSTGCFISGAGAVFEFNGSAPQTVSFTYTPSTSLGTVEIAPGASVTLATDAVANGAVTVYGDLSTTAGRTVTTNQSLTVDGGVLTNPGTFRYNTTYSLLNGGTLASGSNTPVEF